MLGIMLNRVDISVLVPLGEEGGVSLQKRIEESLEQELWFTKPAPLYMTPVKGGLSKWKGKYYFRTWISSVCEGKCLTFVSVYSVYLARYFVHAFPLDSHCTMWGNNCASKNILEKWRNLSMVAHRVRGLSLELLLLWHYVASLNPQLYHHLMKNWK